MSKKKWEYLVLKAEDLDPNWRRTNLRYVSANRLNELGQDGWEMVSAAFDEGEILTAVFKRELDE